MKIVKKIEDQKDFNASALSQAVGAVVAVAGVGLMFLTSNISTGGKRLYHMLLCG